jgi:hypothetical protein
MGSEQTQEPRHLPRPASGMQAAVEEAAQAPDGVDRDQRRSQAAAARQRESR